MICIKLIFAVLCISPAPVVHRPPPPDSAYQECLDEHDDDEDACEHELD